MLSFRHPAAVIDSVVADLDYLTEFLLAEIDGAGSSGHEPSANAMKAIAALETLRLLTPRLRVVRSNFVADVRLPDSEAGRDLLASGIAETEVHACQATATDRNAGVVR